MPFELKRPSSLLSIIAAFVISGFFIKIGEIILENILGLLARYAPSLGGWLTSVFTFSIRINLAGLIIFVIILFPIYRYVYKYLIKKRKKEIVFEDDFDFGNKGWQLNYRGSNNPDKTCRIEQSSMVFEAEDSDLTNPRKENGAYIDLESGFYQGSRYEISSWVKSSENTRMGFKLWVHDKLGKAEMKFPAKFYTPGNEYEEVKVGFIATQSQALRIHLHYKAGKGKIFVDRVKVVKV